MGMASITADLEGNYITKPSNFTDFCMKYTRKTEKGAKRCYECDIKGGKDSEKTKKAVCYFCHAGLMDFASPIIIDGTMVGSIIGGQVLPKEPDEAKFIQIAKEIGVDPDNYVKELKKIRIVPEANIRAAADLLYMVINLLSNFWYQEWLLKQTITEFKSSLVDIESTIVQVKASCKASSDSQEELCKQINTVNSISGNIDSVLVLIKNISDQIKMLGLNASIEAARVGEAGKGFAVVSQEIHKLSEKSKETVQKISDFTGEINKTVNKAVELSDKTSVQSTNQIKSMNQISDELNIMNVFAEKLTEISNKVN